MQIIFGKLSIDVESLTSILELGGGEKDFLLLAGFPDAEQASHAATNFIVNQRHLGNGAMVVVTGTRSAIGTQPVIVMSDINASGQLTNHVLAAMEGKPSLAGSGRFLKRLSAKSDGKKAGGKKRGADS
jgi:hypothetical protein